MSDSSRHSLHAIAEVTYGVTPNNPNLKTIRHTGTNLALTKSTFASEELRADRQISDFRHGTRQTGGDISGELTYGTYDDFLEAALCGTWAVKAAPYTANTISAAAADNSINDSANGLPLLTPGDRVTISGMTGAGTTANQAKLIVVTSTAAKMVLSGGVAFVNDAAGEAVTVTTLTQVLKAGVTRRSFSMLRRFEDLGAGAKGFHLFIGQEINRLTLQIGVNSAVKVTFGVIGKDMNAPADAAPAGTAYTAPNNNGMMDSFSGLIYEGASVSAVVTELNATLDNGIEPKFVVGSETTNRPSINKSNATGQVTAYFEDAALLEKFLNETESSLRVNLEDIPGNAYRVTFPRVKYTDGNAPAQGGTQMITLPFQALYDAATGTNVIIERNAA